MPSTDMKLMRSAIQALNPVASTVTKAAQRSRTTRSGSSVCFQRAIGPTPMRNTTGAIKGAKTASK